MPVTVAVNFFSVAHAGSNGMCMAFPDACKTPSPSGPIPIPYPNIAQTSDVADGSSSVKIDGQSVCVKGCNLSTSTGDEAGSAGGVVSSKFKGKAEFANYSFNVKIEGSGVCRMLDPTMQNEGSNPNAMGVNLQAPV